MLGVLKSSYDGSSPVVLVVAVPRASMGVTEILLVQVMWKITEDEASHGVTG